MLINVIRRDLQTLYICIEQYIGTINNRSDKRPLFRYVCIYMMVSIYIIIIRILFCVPYVRLPYAIYMVHIPYILF